MQRVSVCQIEENDQRPLKLANNTLIISSKKTREWKKNAGGFLQDVLTDDNKKKNDDDNEHINRSSSTSSAAAAADCLIQRQRRKQTRLERKTGSEKRKEKQKKKNKKKKKEEERNKKSPSLTSEAEATEASLFQFFAVDTSNSFYPHERTRCAVRSTNNEPNRFSKQTSGEHHHKSQQKLEVHSKHPFFFSSLSPSRSLLFRLK